MKYSILLADNDPEILNSVGRYLERQGYDVLRAADPESALALTRDSAPSVAVLDLRLINNKEESDMSGLTLARCLPANIPKIILTDFPTWGAVRESMRPDRNQLPAVSTFLSKREGPKAVFNAIRLALAPTDEDVLETFEIDYMHALPERISALGVVEGSRRLEALITRQREDLDYQRNLENIRATRYHRFGLAASSIGFVLMLSALAVGITASSSAAVVPAATGCVAQAVFLLFTRNEEKAHARVQAYLPQLQRLYDLAAGLEMCKEFESKEKRDSNRERVLQRFLDSVGQCPSITRSKRQGKEK